MGAAESRFLANSHLVADTKRLAAVVRSLVDRSSNLAAVRASAAKVAAGINPGSRQRILEMKKGRSDYDRPFFQF
jgi:hypothetical protein